MSTVGVVLAILGLASVTEDLGRWHSALGSISSDQARWVFVIVGLAGIAAGVVIFRGPSRSLRIVTAGPGTARIRDGAAERQVLDAAGFQKAAASTDGSNRLQLDAHFHVTNASEHSITILSACLKRSATISHTIKTSRHSSDPESLDEWSVYTEVIEPGLVANVDVQFITAGDALPERALTRRVVLNDQFGGRHVSRRVRFDPKATTVFGRRRSE